MKTVFIDGSAGTTGLRIRERLSQRKDLILLSLPEAERKDQAARARALNAADLAFLCLPDDAAREAVSLCENPHTVLVDTSTAHRTNPDWAYGFPELGASFREKICAARRIAVPGCHAGGFIALVRPLVEAGVLPRETSFSCFSLTGYSGGGKKMIAAYASDERSTLLQAPRVYGLTQIHKHLPEMRTFADISAPPVFLPTVGDFYAGMLMSVPLHACQLMPGKTVDDVRRVYASVYNGPVVRYCEQADEEGFLAANRFEGRDCMEISVQGNKERFVLAARYDNLGKGASGAAVQCMNLALGINETEGLILDF